MLRSKNNYLRFAVNAILFLLIIFIFDQLIGRTFKHFYFTSKTGENYQTTYAMDSTTAEIIILGSSRARHHYISKIIEDSLGISCYNTGKNGNYLIYNYIVFNSIIKRHTPKIIILDISPEEMCIFPKIYDGLSGLLPYYQDKPEISKFINLKSNYERIKMFSLIYPFNSRLLAIMDGNINRKLQTIDTLKGYQPLYGSNVNQEINGILQDNDASIDTMSINLFRQIAMKCSEKGIKLLVCSSPRYAKLDQQKLESIITEICLANHAEFYNYRNDSTFMENPTLFKDIAHLNNEGAKIFTLKVMQRIKF